MNEVKLGPEEERFVKRLSASLRHHDLEEVGDDDEEEAHFFEDDEIFEGTSFRSSVLIDHSCCFYGYIILLFGTMVKIFSGPGQSAVIGVFLDDWIAEMKISRTAVSAMYGAATVLSACTLPFSIGKALDKLGARIVTLAVAACLGLTAMVLSTVTSPFPLFLCFYCLRLFGQGGMILCGRVVINQWFVRAKGKAQGIASLGLSLFLSGVFPALAVRMRADLGWKSSYLILGCVLLGAIAPISFLFIRDSPERYGLLPDNEKRSLINADSDELNELQAWDELDSDDFVEEELGALMLTHSGELIHSSSVFTDEELAEAQSMYVYQGTGVLKSPDNELEKAKRRSSRRLRFNETAEVFPFQASHPPTVSDTDDAFDDEDEEESNDGLQLAEGIELAVLPSQALCTASFWSFALSQAVIALIATGIYFDMRSILTERLSQSASFQEDLDRVQSTVYISSAVFAGIFNLLSGYLIDRFRRASRHLFSFSLMLFALSLLILAFSTSFTSLILFAILNGSSSGLRLVVFATIFAQMFGRKHLGAIQSSASSLTIIGSALGPFPLSVAVDFGSSYSTSLLILAILPFILSFVTFFVKPPSTFNRHCC